jgi:predicted dehydrogenase
VKAASTKTKIEPNFYDGMKEMEVLEAGLHSAETGKTVAIA